MDKPDEFGSGRAELLGNLEALRGAVSATKGAFDRLDNAWFDAVEAEIKTTSPPRPATTDPSGFFTTSAIRCEVRTGSNARNSSLSTVGGEISDDVKFALTFAGLDPIRTTLPQLDARLDAFATLGFKPKAVQVNLAELRAATNIPSFKNQLFELSVLGDLALKKVLTHIEEASTSSLTSLESFRSIQMLKSIRSSRNCARRSLKDVSWHLPREDPQCCSSRGRIWERTATPPRSL